MIPTLLYYSGCMWKAVVALCDPFFLFSSTRFSLSYVFPARAVQAHRYTPYRELHEGPFVHTASRRFPRRRENTCLDLTVGRPHPRLYITP